MGLTKKEVINYYNNQSNQDVLMEFLRRYVEEEKKKEWHPIYPNLFTYDIIETCFHEMFGKLNINTVEEISTGKILKIY